MSAWVFRRGTVTPGAFDEVLPPPVAPFKPNRYARCVKLFAFDEVGADLGLMPVAARRALDRAGLRLSLSGWRSLPHDAREAVTTAGSRTVVDTGLVAERVARAAPAAELVTPLDDGPEDEPPEELRQVLGSARPLPDLTWSRLTALERYALSKALRSKRRERLDRAYEEIVGARATSTHVSPRGDAEMVRISEKSPSKRRAVATSQVSVELEVLERLLSGDVPKGDVLGTARLAGILAAKRTPEWIPLCHPLTLTHISIALEVDRSAGLVRITSEVEAIDRTGVEMEALVGASAAALTIYDMLKGLDRGMLIGPTVLLEKSGGKSGDYRREG